MKNLKKYGSRKFIIAILMLAGITALGAYGKVDGGGITIVYGIVGAGYGLTNIADKREQNEKAVVDSSGIA